MKSSIHRYHIMVAPILNAAAVLAIGFRYSFRHSVRTYGLVALVGAAVAVSFAVYRLRRTYPTTIIAALKDQLVNGILTYLALALLFLVYFSTLVLLFGFN
jgi:hypothetical protein